MSEKLESLLKKAAAQVAAMSPEDRALMLKQQAESIARAEASWPVPKYHWEIRDGQRCKVYESWEDYCND